MGEADTNENDVDGGDTRSAEEPARGQKRPLDETESKQEESQRLDSSTGDLPEGMTVEWTDGNALVTFEASTEESYLCMVGRAFIKCIQGNLQILGHSFTPGGPEVLVTSPVWSSWATLQVDIGTSTTKVQLSSVRGNPSFRLVPPTRPTVIPPSWKSSADQLINDLGNAPTSTRDSLEAESTYQHSKQVVMICGAKGVGKSTLLRYLTNRIVNGSDAASDNQYQEVAILDADVGQPELAPPGMLRLSIQRQSLLQPPYWNLCDPFSSSFEPIASVFYGAVTSKTDPTRYTEGIQRLLQEYYDYNSRSPTPIPLLINLDGWVKSLGYQILTALIASIQPSHICQLLGDSKGKTFELGDVISQEESTTKLFFLDACSKHVTPSSIPSSTLRTLRLSTYFGPHLLDLWDSLDMMPLKQIQSGLMDDDCILASYLASERPYVVPMEAVTCRHVGSDGQDLQAEEHILQALNGSMVALCTDSNLCLGLGLVRSIDWGKRLLFILTPAEEGQLQGVTNLVGGHIPLPLSFRFRGVFAESFPFLSSQSTDSSVLGAEPMKSRNNIGRKGMVARP